MFVPPGYALVPLEPTDEQRAAARYHSLPADIYKAMLAAAPTPMTTYQPPKRKLLIALDYDKTTTEDEALWLAFVKSAQARGHRVVVMTMRYDSLEERLPIWVEHAVDRIYYTEREAKATFAVNNNLKVDIWIDDSPYWLLHDAGDRIPPKKTV